MLLRVTQVYFWVTFSTMDMKTNKPGYYQWQQLLFLSLHIPPALPFHVSLHFKRIQLTWNEYIPSAFLPLPHFFCPVCPLLHLFLIIFCRNTFVKSMKTFKEINKLVNMRMLRNWSKFLSLRSIFYKESNQVPKLVQSIISENKVKIVLLQ